MPRERIPMGDEKDLTAQDEIERLLQQAGEEGLTGGHRLAGIQGMGIAQALGRQSTQGHALDGQDTDTDEARIHEPLDEGEVHVLVHIGAADQGGLFLVICGDVDFPPKLETAGGKDALGGDPIFWSVLSTD